MTRACTVPPLRLHPHRRSQALLPSPHSEPAGTPRLPSRPTPVPPTSLPVGVQNPSHQPGPRAPQEPAPGQVLSVTWNPSSLQKPPLRDPASRGHGRPRGSAVSSPGGQRGWGGSHPIPEAPKLCSMDVPPRPPPFMTHPSAVPACLRQSRRPVHVLYGMAGEQRPLPALVGQTQLRRGPRAQGIRLHLPRVGATASGVRRAPDVSCGRGDGPADPAAP